MSKIYTISDLNKDIFYKLPKAFFHNPHYLTMKNETKIAYCLLRDLLLLSVENGWVNDKNQPFVRISREKLMFRLQIKGTQKMATVMKELVDNELIVEKRLGQGNTNIIYICIPDELENIIYDDEELLGAITEQEIESECGKIQTFENQKSAQTVVNTKTFENQKSKEWIIKSLESIISKRKNKQNQSVIKNNTIKTNLSDNHLNDNDYIKELWSSYHKQQIQDSTFNILSNLGSQYESDMIECLIELSTNATTNVNMYIRGIVRKWKENNINTFDEYYIHESNK